MSGLKETILNKDYWFILTMISVFLGSKPLGIPTPFFTLNLGMILPLLMIFYFVRKIGIDRKIILYTLPLTVLSIYSCIQLLFVKDLSLGIQDSRSLILMTLTSILILYSRKYFEKVKFHDLMSKVFWTLFLMLSIFGLFEYFTGIHIWATGIDVILNFAISDFTFAPRFIWGNPNNFVTSFLVVSAGILYFDLRFTTNIFKQFLVLTFLFFFSDTAQSKFGILSAICLVFYILFLNKTLLIEKLKYNKKSLLFGLVFLGAILINSDWFLGPKFGKNRTYYLNNVLVQNPKTGVLSFVKTDTLTNSEKDSLIKSLKYAQDKKHLSSTELRKNLIKNGVYYFESAPLTGIGPGQYQYRNREGENKYEIETLQGSHHFFVDIFSQYGSIGIIFLIIYLVWLIRYFKGIKGWDTRFSSLVVLIFLFFASNLPSKFSTYECSYIALAITTLIAYSYNLKEDENRV